MMRSTFAGFTTAFSALSASHRALEVTGQNIANVNTPGYTRQQLDLRSLYLQGAEFYNSNPNARIGFGVEITGVSQLRDPFLDNQYRAQMAKVGTSDAQVSGMDKLANFLDETDSSGIKEALANLNSQLQYLSVHPNDKTYDSMVRSSCQMLLNLFHQNATELKGVRDDLSTEFSDTTVKDANEILKNLAELNETIRNSEILGNPALELKDQRNELIDELASYLPITTNYRDEPLVKVTSTTDPDKELVGRTIEMLDIYFTASDGQKYLLVSDNKYGSFTSDGLTDANKNLNEIAELNQKIADATAAGEDTTAMETQRDELVKALENFLTPENPKTGDQTKVELDDATGDVTYTDSDGKTHSLIAGGQVNELSAQDVPLSMKLSVTDVNKKEGKITDTVADGVMRGTLDMLNKSGGFDNPPSDVRGIGYYEQSMDAMVAKFAAVFNDLNQTYDENGVALGTVLFEVIDGSKPFSVGNIKIADGWANGDYGITTSKDKVETDQDPDVGTTADENILKMIEALSKDHRFYDPKENPQQTDGQGVSFYKGSFYNCFVNMENTLNIDLKAAKNTLDNKITVINQTADLKDEISAVSLDEEGINLLHYQQSYSAAARLMTTLDEALDKLINGTGVVGR